MFTDGGPKSPRTLASGKYMQVAMTQSFARLSYPGHLNTGHRYFW